ncbi:Uma2 family endonuclease [Oceanobacillus sp. HCA-5259]|uniref:Uma2 family endonuclease n=1 Tax=Oceanobacillus sp. HCA-5259 TaxID=3134661 RepID=UPI0030EB1A85
MSMTLDNKKHSYADYVLEKEETYEVIAGEILNMSLPSPTPKHQDVVAELTAEFKMFLRGKECIAFSAPMDVCLFATETTKKENIFDWVQPDLFVICDRKKIKDTNIVGAPDFVIEVLSPSTARIDRWIKFNSYEKAGVKEYWIVDPANMFVEVYKLRDTSFHQAGIYEQEESITVEIFPDLKIDLKNIFKERV